MLLTKTLDKYKQKDVYWLCDKIVIFQYQDTEFEPIEKHELQWFGLSTLGLDESL